MAGKPPSRALATCLAAPALLFGLSAAAPPSAVGIVAVVIKEVTLRNPGAPSAHPARTRESVVLAEQVATGAASHLQLLLLDQSSFTVGANARLTIDRFVYDPDQKSNFTASIAKGAFRFMSGRNGHSATSSIKSPVAAIGIRGTIIDGVVGQQAIDIVRRERNAGNFTDPDPETATLVVLRGPGTKTGGRVTPGAMTVEAGGKTVEANQPSLAVFVPRPGAGPIGPFPISPPGIAELDSYVLPPIEAKLPVGEPSTYVAPPPDRYRPYPPGAGFGPEPGPGSPGPTIPNLSVPARPVETTPTQAPARGQTSPNNPPPRTSTTNRVP